MRCDQLSLKFLTSLGVAVLLCTSIAVLAGKGPPEYRLIDLTTETGQAWGWANDISDTGFVVGGSSGSESGFVIWQWVSGEWIMIDLVFDLPLCWAEDALAVSDSGAAVGRGYCINFGPIGILWEHGASGEAILGGSANDINNLNQVVADGWPEGGAVLWDDGEITVLEPLGAAFGVNHHSEVVGVGGNIQAALWVQADGGEWQHIDLGTLGGDLSWAVDINEIQQIVGASWLDSDGEDIHPFLWEDGVMTDLGLLPGFGVSSGNGINVSGQVVGTAWTADWETSRPFLWSDAVLYDINDLIVSGPDLELREAQAIDNHGRIVGQGSTPDGTEAHAFIAIPIIAGDLNGDGAVDPFDLALLLGNWGPCPADPADCPADLSGDGTVDAPDLAILLGSWGT